MRRWLRRCALIAPLALGARAGAQAVGPEPAPPAAPATPAAPASSVAAVRVLPPVRALVARALYAARARGPRATRELARRARLSGLMPEVRIGLERGSQLDLASSDSGQSSRTSTAQGDALKLQASVSFDLPRLVFASEEVRILSVERWLANDLQELSAQVVALCFRHRRAARALVEGELDKVDELDEIEALLDMLTDGAVAASRGQTTAGPTSEGSRAARAP
jgi:hypothetical protein